MAKVQKVSVSVVRFWCAGCVAYHSFGRQTSRFNGDYERPTFGVPLIISDGRGGVACEATIQDGIVTYTMRSRHKLAGQRMEMTAGRL